LLLDVKKHQKKFQRPIETFSLVLDLQGVKLDGKSSQFLNMCSENDNLNYPERLGRMIVINSPWIFPFLWKIVSPFIDAKTKAKISIIYGKYTEELIKFISPDTLPKEYGGQCECLGVGKKCVEVFDINDLKLSDVSSSSGETSETDKVTIPAGKKFEVKLSVNKTGGSIHWFFRVEKDYNINFSVEFMSDNNEKKVIKTPAKLLADQGEYNTVGGGTATVIFDNSFSYFRSKSMQYSAIVLQNDDKPPVQGTPEPLPPSIQGKNNDDQTQSTI